MIRNAAIFIIFFLASCFLLLASGFSHQTKTAPAIPRDTIQIQKQLHKKDRQKKAMKPPEGIKIDSLRRTIDVPLLRLKDSSSTLP
jgi:hypothetical protein